MPLYLAKFSLTPEAWAKLIKEPEDRREAVGRLVEASGGKLLGYWYASGDHDGDRAGDRGRQRCVQLAVYDGAADGGGDAGCAASGAGYRLSSSRRLTGALTGLPRQARR